ncbi:MAG: phage portal protein [Oscillospiraceae bacterium]
MKRSGLYSRGERELALVNGAKVLCDTLSDMTFGQQVDIIIGNKNKQKFVDRVLQDNAFWDRMPQIFSLGYALGGALVKVFVSGGAVKLDYSSAEDFIPLGWDSAHIDEGIFRSRFCRGGMYYTLFEKHGHSSDGSPEVSRKLFCSHNSSDMGTENSLGTLFPEMQPVTAYPFGRKMFSYFHPAASNNIMTDSGIGLSVFYNCRDTLKALDIAFDSLMREFILGRKRIIVPSSCIRTVVDPESGEVRRYFDADDEVYQALRCEDEKDLKIIDNTAELRVDEHVSAVNALLNILCFQTGLSSGTLSFGSASGVRTAAEIESQENRTSRTVNSNRNIAAEFIEDIVRSIISAGVYIGELNDSETDIRISFSKELDISVDSQIDRTFKLMDHGIIDTEKARENLAETVGGMTDTKGGDKNGK